MAEVIKFRPDWKPYPRRVQRAVAHVDLSRPGAVQALQEVATDWLFERCSDEGKRKLLAQHDLLAA